MDSEKIQLVVIRRPKCDGEETVDFFVFSQLIMKIDPRLEEIFKQFNFVRFPVKHEQCCGEILCPLGILVHVVVEVGGVAIASQLFKGQQNLVCFNCCRGVTIAEL